MFEELGPAVSDPYEYHLADRDLWLKLLADARSENFELFAILQYLRGAGTALVKDTKFGYRLQPLIGNNAWSSQAEYDREKQYLRPYMGTLMKLLRCLK